ncbi:hypothetical protein [Mycobacterium sp. IS-1496]|nr:hypothetical protein [Mycobacterium sp. IS-1496]
MTRHAITARMDTTMPVALMAKAYADPVSPHTVKMCCAATGIGLIG